MLHHHLMMLKAQEVPSESFLFPFAPFFTGLSSSWKEMAVCKCFPSWMSLSSSQSYASIKCVFNLRQPFINCKLHLLTEILRQICLANRIPTVLKKCLISFRAAFYCDHDAFSHWHSQDFYKGSTLQIFEASLLKYGNFGKKNTDYSKHPHATMHNFETATENSTFLFWKRKSLFSSGYATVSHLARGKTSSTFHLRIVSYTSDATLSIVLSNRDVGYCFSFSQLGWPVLKL